MCSAKSSEASELTPQAIKDVTAFDAGTRNKIKDAIRYLADHPLDGKPLKGKFQRDKVWSYRVWLYQILYRKTGTEWLSVEHRKDIYR